MGEHFALMVDEDKTTKSRCCFVLHNNIHEEFLNFIPAEGLDAVSTWVSKTDVG